MQPCEKTSGYPQICPVENERIERSPEVRKPNRFQCGKDLTGQENHLEKPGKNNQSGRIFTTIIFLSNYCASHAMP